MYYTGIGEGSRHPDAQGYILSAVSTDAKSWFKEEGVRVDVDIHSLGSLRVLCPDVLQLEDGRWRMYFEARAPQRALRDPVGHLRRRPQLRARGELTPRAQHPALSEDGPFAGRGAACVPERRA